VPNGAKVLQSSCGWGHGEATREGPERGDYSTMIATFAVLTTLFQLHLLYTVEWEIVCWLWMVKEGSDRKRSEHILKLYFSILLEWMTKSMKILSQISRFPGRASIFQMRSRTTTVYLKCRNVSLINPLKGEGQPNYIKRSDFYLKHITFHVR
jgi:hypothetical protein